MKTSKIEKIYKTRNRFYYIRKYEEIYWKKIRPFFFLESFLYMLFLYFLCNWFDWFNGLNIPYFEPVILFSLFGIAALLFTSLKYNYLPSKVYKKLQMKSNNLKNKQQKLDNELKKQFYSLDIQDVVEAEDFLKKCDEKFIAKVLQVVENKNGLNKEFWHSHKKIKERADSLSFLEELFELTALCKLQEELREEQMTQEKIEERINQITNKNSIKINIY